MTLGSPSYRASRVNAGYSRGGFLSRMVTALSLLLCLCCLPSVLEAQWANGQSATYVIGQPDFISSAAATTQQGLNTPSDVEIDLANGKMYVADRLNNRILRYSYPVTSNYPMAEIVFGQPNFTSSGTGTSANTFGNAIRGITLDAAGNLYVADASNSRVLRFNAAYSIATNQPNGAIAGYSLQ
jgi:hypothetical protein